MGEWLLSRRDRLIVARHEVPGNRCRPVPEGRPKSLSVPEIFVVETPGASGHDPKSLSAFGERSDFTRKLQRRVLGLLA
jgi:hypothetical protein